MSDEASTAAPKRKEPLAQTKIKEDASPVAPEWKKPLAQTRIKEYMVTSGTPTGGLLQGFGCFSKTGHKSKATTDKGRKEFMGSFGIKTRGETTLSLVVVPIKESDEPSIYALSMSNTYAINEFWKRQYGGDGLGKLFPGFHFARETPPDPLSGSFDDYPFLQAKTWIALPATVGRCTLHERASNIISWCPSASCAPLIRSEAPW